MVDEQRRRWLEALAAACERLLARRDDTPRRRDPQYVALLQEWPSCSRGSTPSWEEIAEARLVDRPRVRSARGRR
jgi:hypothetical protein